MEKKNIYFIPCSSDNDAFDCLDFRAKAMQTLQTDYSDIFSSRIIEDGDSIQTNDTGGFKC